MSGGWGGGRGDGDGEGELAWRQTGDWGAGDRELPKPHYHYLRQMDRESP